jgi:hypothetical protein
MNTRSSKLFALVDVAEKMIAGEIDPIAGSWEIVALRWQVANENSHVFDAFIGIDSEADNLRLGDRALWSDEFLRERDREYAEYARSLQPEIADDCRALLAVIVPWLRACPVCGFAASRPPYDAAGEPSYEQCRSCGFEFGVTENAGYDIAEWRRRWVAVGMPFRRPPAPPHWDPALQMGAAGIT